MKEKIHADNIKWYTDALIYSLGIIVVILLFIGYILNSVKTPSDTLPNSAQVPITAQSSDAFTIPSNLVPILKPSPTPISYRQTFVRNCPFIYPNRNVTGVYCTCLYDILHQSYTDGEISNGLVKKVSPYKTEPMFINANLVCDERFR